jgi:predicted N-acyltransferase
MGSIGDERGSGAASDTLAVDVADRIDAVDPAAWDAAVRAQGLPVFYSHSFLSAYERHPLTEVDGVAYLTVWRRGVPGPPVAVVPAYFQRRPDPLGHLASAYPEAAGQPTLLSHCWHCYDGHLGGLDGGTAGRAAVAGTVMAALRGLARELGAPWCGVMNVRHGGPTATALAAAGLPLRPLAQRFGTDLGGLTGFDDFLDRSAGQRARANLRRHRRRAAENGVHTAALPVAAADLAGVWALCNLLAGRHGDAERYYPSGRFERFLTALGPSVRIVEVRQYGRLVAAAACLLDTERLHWWAGGADYEVAGNFSPYYVMFAETVELALRLRRPDFEGGRGNPAFKLRNGLTARPLDACLVRA